MSEPFTIVTMKAFFLGVFLFVPILLVAQIEITFPVNRSVFQRNNDNWAIIPVAGTFSVPIDRVDVKLTPINGGNPLDWTTISYNPNYGYFNGNLFVVGGWYKLEVRGFNKGSIVGYSTLDKFGVGEVFLISGQSNAQGYFGFGNPSAKDDRVNCVSNFFSASDSDVPFPEVSFLSENASIAPFGKGSWCWGRLGDLLVQKLGVPVMFMNAAFEAMAIEEWKKSAEGGRGYNFYVNNFAEIGFPYKNLQRALNYYVNMFGIRAVLWHQGESDRDLQTSSEKYINQLNDLITRTRNQSGKNMSWVVSRVSLTKNGTYQPIIDAQNHVIQNTWNVFAGPNTDIITSRVDGVHFYGNSLNQLAEAWNNSLDNQFFRNSTTYQPANLLNYVVDCEAQNAAPLKVNMQNGFQTYEWLNESGNVLSRNLETRLGSGTYRGKAVDYLGNVYYTPKVRFTGELFPTKPTINFEGEPSFCEGSSLKLTSSEDSKIYWTTSEQSQTIFVTQPGVYHVRKFNQYGCSTKSDDITVKLKPSPPVRISTDGETTFCADKSVTISSTSKANNLWSNGEFADKIVANKSGEYFVKVSYENGCVSTSNKINLTVNPLPEKPNVVVDGPTLFCADKTLRLSTNLSKGFTWSDGSKNQTIVINKTGEYSVIAENEFGCKTFSEKIPVRVNPLPAKPIITSSGPTVFCDGETLTLTSSENKGYEWSDGSRAKTIGVKKTGNFSVKVFDENGCISPPSDEISVITKPNPADVSILQTGTYTLEVITSGQLLDQVYEWYKDDVKLANQALLLKAKQTGKYAAKGSVVYQLPDGKTLRCFSRISIPYNFKIDENNRGMSIFPNPIVDEKMNIETLDDHQNATVQIISMTGFLIKEFKVDKFDNRKTFDLKDLPKGKNFVRLIANNYDVVKAVFIE